MHEYELVVVMNPDIVEEDVPAALERVASAVTSRGGEVVDVLPWGRRRLAYAIARHTEGNYVLHNIKLDPLRAHELESGFAISDDILRHLLIRKDEGTFEEAAAAAAAAAERAAAAQPAASATEAPTAASEPAVEAEAPGAETEPATETESSADAEATAEPVGAQADGSA